MTKVHLRKLANKQIEQHSSILFNSTLINHSAPFAPRQARLSNPNSWQRRGGNCQAQTFMYHVGAVWLSMRTWGETKWVIVHCVFIHFSFQWSVRLWGCAIQIWALTCNHWRPSLLTWSPQNSSPIVARRTQSRWLSFLLMEERKSFWQYWNQRMPHNMVWQINHGVFAQLQSMSSAIHSLWVIRYGHTVNWSYLLCVQLTVCCTQ